MFKFSYRSDREIRKNISKIAEIIQGENFDILTMQEVLNEALIRDMLMRELGPQWTYVWDQPVSRSIQAAEGYAYLWRTSKFRLASGQKNPNDNSPAASKVFSPHIYRQYSADPLLTNGRLIRDPFYARFESLNGWYEIRLINTHIMFQEKEASDKSIYTISNPQKRIQKFEKLIDIFEKVSDKQYRSSRPSYTFILCQRR